MALKNSARWRRKEREIEWVHETARPKERLVVENGQSLSTEDIEEALRRDSPSGKRALETLLP